VGKPSLCSDRGAALIVALWVIGLLSLLVVSFAFDALLEGKVASFARKRRKAEYLALSGMTVAEMLLDKQRGVSGNESEEVRTDDRWYEPALALRRGRPVMNLEVPLGEGVVRLDIMPEPSRRNVNRMTDEDWERVLRQAGVPEEQYPALIDSFYDWIDADSKPRQDGAETEDYYATLPNPYQARNGPLDTVRELLLVKGFNEALLSGGVLNPDDPAERQVHVAGIEKMLTTYGDGKVNVNAASTNVLMTLPGVDELVALAIVEERERGRTSARGAETGNDTSYESVPDLLSRIPGLDPRMSGLVSTRSDIYRVTAVGSVGRVTRRIWAIVNQSGRTMQVLRWREEP
jgi:general secretion pathway protein K